MVSGLFHPLIMPTVGILLTLFVTSQYYLLTFQGQRAILLIVAINTTLIPLIMIPLFYRFGIIKSIQMHHHKERVIPLLFSFLLNLFSFFFLVRLPIARELSSFLLGTSIAILATLIISIWWKISIHMVGLGGLFALAYAITLRFPNGHIWFVVVVVMVAGITAWARITLNSHKPLQVYMGFALGVIAIAAAMI